MGLVDNGSGRILLRILLGRNGDGADVGLAVLRHLADLVSAGDGHPGTDVGLIGRAGDAIGAGERGFCGSLGSLGLGGLALDLDLGQLSHLGSDPFLAVPGHLEGDGLRNGGVLAVLDGVSLSILRGGDGDGADIVVAVLRHLTDREGVRDQVHLRSAVIAIFGHAGDDVGRGDIGGHGSLGNNLDGLVVLADQPPLRAVERVGRAEGEAVVRLSVHAQTVVKGIAEAVDRDRFEVHAVFGHINVAAALGNAHVLSGDDDLLDELDELLHGSGQLLHGFKVALKIVDVVGVNAHVIEDVVGAVEVIVNAVIERRVVVLGEGLAQRLDYGSVGMGPVLKAGCGKRAEQVCQQVVLGVDACAGKHGVIVGDRGEGGGVKECEQLADILADLRLAAHLVNGHRAVLVPRQLQQLADVVEESVPLHRLPEGKVAIRELADRLKQAAGVKRAAVELVVVDGHAPDILVFIVAEAGADAGNAALGEHVRLVTDDQLDVLVLVHAVEVDGLLQILVHEAKVEVEHDLDQRDLLVIVLADVEVVAEHRQNACAGAGTRGVDAEGILCIVILLVTNDRMPLPSAVALLLAADDGEGLHGVLSGHVLRRTGADGDVELVVELDDLPDGAAVDAVGEMERRVVEELRLCCDDLEALRIVRRLRRINLCLKLTVGFLRHAADDQLVLVYTHAADAGGDVLLEAFVELTDVHAVDLLALVRLGIDLPDLGRVIDRAAEVELAMVFHGVAEADVVLRVSFRAAGEQDLHLAGFDVELDERTTGGFAVCLLREEVTVKNDVQDAGQKLGVILVAEAAVHQLDGLAQGVVEKARVDPVAIAYGRPGVGLAAAAGIVCAADVGAEDAVAGVINKAVVSSAALILGVGGDQRVGDFFCHVSVFTLILVGEQVCGFGFLCERRSREQSDYHHKAEQNAQ